MTGLKTKDFPGEWPAHEQYCTHCEKALNPDKMVWLELDQRTGRFVDPTVTQVPADKSQGCFPFGTACARKILKAA